MSLIIKSAPPVKRDWGVYWKVFSRYNGCPNQLGSVYFGHNWKIGENVSTRINQKEGNKENWELMHKEIASKTVLKGFHVYRTKESAQEALNSPLVPKNSIVLAVFAHSDDLVAHNEVEAVFIKLTLLGAFVKSYLV